MSRRLFLKALSTDLVRNRQVTRPTLSYIPKNLRKRIRPQQNILEDITAPQNEPGPSRGRCGVCSRANDNKYSVKCNKCGIFICKTHTQSIFCSNCVDR
ncbi:hypothetical protein ABEB36_014965 [Hypothenemus hampei]|uniref:PiggyBac transposable element-derived protein 4 C-terminal zinc-ribbon domain-containing protein n=1 Tax=Hypothenemus hampei TaxID=57062 RepID=A0ABD1E1E7_HYPHA